jgi:hypothetical protein
MRISNAFFVAVLFCSPCVVTTAQSPADGTPVQGAPSAPPAPSGLLRPALDKVQQTVSALKVHTTLPPLLDTADASPGTISKMLPVSRNIAALYDVLLSVAEAARIAASAEDATQLQQALMSLGSARVALDDRLQASAAALEKQEIDLRSTLQAREAVTCPVIPPPAKPVCPAPAPVRKAKRIHKPPTTPPQPSTSPANSTPKSQN